MSAIDSSLAALNGTLTDLAAQSQKRDAANIRTFTAYVEGTRKEKIDDAKYIEDLRPDQNRLNVFSTMVNGDNLDYYKFTLKSNGKVNFSLLVNQLDDHGNDLKADTSTALGVQILQMHGNRPVVIADSNLYEGQNHENYLNLQADGLDLKGGKYVVKVSRAASADSSANYFYSFQLSSGRYHQDFDTIQTAAPKPKGTSILPYLQMSAAVGLMAASIDATSAAAGQASMPVNGSALTAGQDNGTDPAVRLLNFFA